MKALTLFLNKVRLEVPQCPRPIMIDAIRQSAIEFCKLSLTWKEWLDPITIVSTERAIEIPHPDDARVFKLLDGKYDDEQLAAITPKKAEEDYVGWEVDLEGDPAVFFMTSTDEVRLAPHPTDGLDLVLYAALRPTETTTKLPDFLYLDHLNTIAMGAKALLMEQINVPWHNPKRAMQLKDKFEDLARQMNVAQTVGYSRARLRTRQENR